MKGKAARKGGVSRKDKKHTDRKYVLTGVPGFDELLGKGIPKGESVLVAGGAGSGKTVFCLQSMIDAARKGEKCLYLSFEESEERLKEHMEDFGWNWKTLEQKGLVRIVRKDPFVLSSSIEAMFAKARGELLIDINEVLEIIPEGFQPDRIFLDSVTAIAAAFSDKGSGYRLFIEQLFRYLETLHSTSFLISETEQVPVRYSGAGIEEFLADGVFVLYAIKEGSIRQNAVEVLKMRGSKHERKIVAMQITERGIVVYPEQEIFGGIKEK
ncbi:AAA family ATPase [Candidatus Woesearchaeota archaeon]|nr:AAA family ATPase [Candidatus Woesearchaeota archaeon]